MNTIDAGRRWVTAEKAWWIAAFFALVGCGSGNTGTPVDTTPHVISVATYPLDKEINVPVSAIISINFNEVMDPSTFGANEITVFDGLGNQVPGTVENWSDLIGIYRAYFIPASPFSESMRYTIVVGAGMKNFSGTTFNGYTWSFITADNMKDPTVASATPADGSAGVSNLSSITASFSELMDLSSVNNNTFMLRDANGVLIGGTISFNGITAVFTPSILLASGATYSAVITTDVKDLYGNSPVSDYSWRFTTTEVPLIQLISPASGETGVSIDTTIIVGTSVTLDYSSINAANFLVKDSHGNPVSITIIPDQNVGDEFMKKFYLVPDAVLAYEESYTVTATSQVKDSQGRLLGKDYSWTFTTGPAGIGSWVSLSTIGAPTDRSNACVVWTGTEMIVWGGYDGTNYVNTGARYNPATDTWQPVSTNGAPPAMTARAVWTGTEMIVWGAGAGGRYNPATDSWRPISTTNAPTPVNNPTVVWAGAEVIVWGGYNLASGQYSNMGARYNPLTDQWKPTSTINAPAARVDHTAIWTGTEMIVWGGFGDYYASNIGQTGGRFNPATDSWLPTTTQGAPAGRNAHAAVWTGTEMIVWGGSSTSLGMNTNTGGIYDPSTDSWQTTSVLGAPAGRRDAVAVWTGTKMIIWGGSNTMGSYLSTGGIYDPSADTWQPTTTINAPVAEYTQLSVWTGTEMIVWGSTSNARGRFKP